MASSKPKHVAAMFC